MGKDHREVLLGTLSDLPADGLTLSDAYARLVDLFGDLAWGDFESEILAASDYGYVDILDGVLLPPR